MIYTITLNPSIDYIVHVQDFRADALNRTDDEHILPGGKGINVSIVLKNLGYETCAFGFVGGFTGTEVERLLRVQSIRTDFIHVNEGITRINVKMKSCGETEINGMGPHVSEEELRQLFHKLDQLKDGDGLVISGSVPKTMPADIYEKILGRLSDRRILIAVDAEKKLLKGVLKYRPFLIKPNLHELAGFFDLDELQAEDAVYYAQLLQKKGARNVLISMGGEGAVLVSEDGIVMKSPAPEGEAVNTIGAGDSMVAGFIAGWLSSDDYEKAFHTGIAAGSASAFSKDLAVSDEVDEVYTGMLEAGIWQK